MTRPAPAPTPRPPPAVFEAAKALARMLAAQQARGERNPGVGPMIATPERAER